MKFSIIIALAPDRNAPVLESIETLDYHKENYEIIIERGLNPSENRNKAGKKAKGEILAIVDDDCNLDKNWLKNAEEFFNKYPIDAVGGPQLTPSSDNLFAKASGYVMSSIFGSFNMAARYKKGKLNLNANEAYLTSANLFIKKQVFEKTKGFDLNLWPGEDPEFIYRLKKAGFKIAYSPDIIVYHKRRPTFKSFFKQFFSYGKQYVQYRNKALKKRISLLHTLPALFTLYLFLLPILYFVNLFFILPFILYMLLNLMFSLSISFKNKNILAFPYLPLLFFAIHISYGLGLVRGVFK